VASATNATSVLAKIGAVMLLFGYFSCFCAIPMFLAAGWRAYREHVIASRWVPAAASVQRCRLDVTHASGRNGGGTYYSLRCLLGYEFASHPYQFELRTTSQQSGEAAARIEDWVAHHRPGTPLVVKVDPSDPGAVAVISELPVHQFSTSREGWIAGILCGLFGLPLAALGRYLLRPRERRG
jgi:hypothetical protein